MSHARPSLPAPLRRRNRFDVTNRVCVADPEAVRDAIFAIFEARFRGFDREPLRRSFETFTQLYAGLLPGYLGCDTWYHDAQHSLDCALAMARLLDGYDRSGDAQSTLDGRRATFGVVIALFHDAGYIRRVDDSAENGAEFTLTHVRRSAEFLSRFLPQIGYSGSAALAARIVHYTGYEIALDQIDVSSPEDRTLGFLLGTADVMAQTSDRCYIEKCRDFLYPEFERCGLAGQDASAEHASVYHSPTELLRGTASFNRKLWDERLDGYFGGVHRYLDVHFEATSGGGNPYIDSIRANIARVEDVVRRKSFNLLNLRPRVVGAQEMRRAARLQLLGQKFPARQAA